MDLTAIRSALQPFFPLGDVEYHRSIGSTNDRVRELGRAGAAEGALVVAERQTGGRGRRGHRWLAEPGTALLFSFSLRPGFRRQSWPLAGLAAAVGVAEAIEELTGLAARCKWPNDVLVRRAEKAGPGKVAGILAEADEDFVVVGIGINVTSAPDLPPGEATLPPTSLAAAASASPDRNALLVAVLRHFSRHYVGLQRHDARGVREGYARLDITAGMTVTLHVGEDAVRGVARGIDATGALLVDTGAAVRRFCAGDVHPEWEADDWMIG